jgi:protocatechuate 3,4-dioxygenase beta subunit
VSRIIRWPLVCFVLCWIFTGLSLSQQTQQNAVEGVVLRSGTNEPMPDVSVLLQPVGRSEAYEVQTANNGRFHFRNIPNGNYTVAAVRSGYVRGDYGRHRTSDPPLVLAVGANRTIGGIEIHMKSSGAIFGRVTDEEGEPVAAAIVRAWQETFIEGQRALRMVTTVSTDDMGNYRLYSLAPGNYYVSTAGNLPSFYPDTTDVRTAGQIRLTEGSMAGGINITQRFETRREIRGTVSSPFPKVSVQLTPRIPIVSEGTLAASVDSRTGQFSIPQVPTGSYILTAMSDEVSTQTSIEVGNARVVDVRLAIPSPVEIRARVSLDPKATSSGIDISDFQFAFLWDSEVPNLPGAAYSPVSENAFTVRLAPGDYRMRAVVMPSNAYVQSIRLRDFDVLNGGLHVDSSVQVPLEIVVAADMGRLEGVVGNAQKHAEPNVVVALVPAQAERRRTDLYLSARTDAEGHFQFEHVSPGDYTIYSWENVEPTAWMNSNFMKDYEDRGKPIHMDAGAHLTIQVEAIP